MQNFRNRGRLMGRGELQRSTLQRRMSAKITGVGGFAGRKWRGGKCWMAEAKKMQIGKGKIKENTPAYTFRYPWSLSRLKHFHDLLFCCALSPTVSYFPLWESEIGSVQQSRVVIVIQITKYLTTSLHAWVYSQWRNWQFFPLQCEVLTVVGESQSQMVTLGSSTGSI